MRDGDNEPVPSDGQFRPGDDTVPTHTMEFVRVDGKDALQRYVPGEYVPRGALPADDPNDEDAPGAHRARRRPTPVHALLGMLFWLATLVLFIVGFNLGQNGSFGAAQVLAFVSIGTSGLGVLFGIIAVVLGRGRELGIVAIVLSVLTNPLVLAELLGWVATLTS
jgi:hypothetical protein